ncbi:hypothetical protein M2125_000643 [Polynucleobacter sphagniphilus]|nr:hypothetical protein [Polynucleobacter sphagniphilus]
MNKCIKASPVLLLFLICTSVFGQTEKIYLSCKTTLEFKNLNLKGEDVSKGEKGILIDAKTGAVLEGSIAAGWNKIDGFKSESSEISFSGSLGNNASSTHTYKPYEKVHIIAYYSFDRITGKFDAYTSYRTLDKDGKISDSRWRPELQEHETGNCEATKGIKF